MSIPLLSPRCTLQEVGVRRQSWTRDQALGCGMQASEHSTWHPLPCVQVRHEQSGNSGCSGLSCHCNTSSRCGSAGLRPSCNTSNPASNPIYSCTWENSRGWFKARALPTPWDTRMEFQASVQHLREGSHRWKICSVSPLCHSAFHVTKPWRGGKVGEGACCGGFQARPWEATGVTMTASWGLFKKGRDQTGSCLCQGQTCGPLTLDQSHEPKSELPPVCHRGRQPAQSWRTPHRTC